MRQFHYPFEELIPIKDDDIEKWYRYIEDKLKPNDRKFRKRLFSKKVCLANFSSPAITLLNHKDYNNHVLLDVELLKEIYGNNKDEIFPILLHEIGHILNIPKDEDFEHQSISKKLKSEIFADDFVRKLGFRDELLKSLQTYKDWKVKNHKMDDGVIDLRIKRIMHDLPPEKGIDIDTYNRKKRKPT